MLQGGLGGQRLRALRQTGPRKKSSCPRPIWACGPRWQGHGRRLDGEGRPWCPKRWDRANWAQFDGAGRLHVQLAPPTGPSRCGSGPEMLLLGALALVVRCFGASSRSDEWAAIATVQLWPSRGAPSQEGRLSYVGFWGILDPFVVRYMWACVCLTFYACRHSGRIS